MLYLLSPVVLGGLSPSDIAKRMGVTKQAVHKQINDLRDILGIGYVRSDSAREKMRHAHLKSLKRRKFIAGLKKKRSDVPGGGRESPKKKGE